MNTQELFASAKERLLAHGEHPPTLLVEYTDASGKPCLDYYHFANFGAETVLEEQKQFFNLGRLFGETNGRVEFTSLVFLSEAWVSHIEPGREKEFKQKYRRPRNDPHRREYLIAQIVTFEPSPSGMPAIKQHLERAEIVRPAKGVIDLVQETEDLGKPSMLFPTYFLSGWSLTQLPPDERRQAEELLKRF